MDHLDFSCHCLIQVYVCFLSTSKVNLCFSNENAMTDFRKTWYVLHIMFMKFISALGIYKYFRHFQLLCKRFASLFQNVFMCPLTKLFAYYQLHRNKSKFLDYISAVIFEKRNRPKLNCGDLTISCLHDPDDTRVQFSELVLVFNLHVAPKIVYFFCLKIWECNKIVTSTRVAWKILKYCYCNDRNI